MSLGGTIPTSIDISSRRNYHLTARVSDDNKNNNNNSTKNVYKAGPAR
jgi:hypothetical protein